MPAFGNLIYRYGDTLMSNHLSPKVNCKFCVELQQTDWQTNFSPHRELNFFVLASGQKRQVRPKSSPPLVFMSRYQGMCLVHSYNKFFALIAVYDYCFSFTYLILSIKSLLFFRKEIPTKFVRPRPLVSSKSASLPPIPPLSRSYKHLRASFRSKKTKSANAIGWKRQVFVKLKHNQPSLCLRPWVVSYLSVYLNFSFHA